MDNKLYIEDIYLHKTNGNKEVKMQTISNIDYVNNVLGLFTFTPHEESTSGHSN
jgi:hypothetical protein